MPLESLLQDPGAASVKLAQLPKLAGYFRRYLREGYYPYLDNTTLYQAMCEGIGQPVDTGTTRELFFLTSAQNAGHAVAYSAEGGDFSIGDAVFEVGGRGKGAKQLPKTTRRAYVVKDDILTGDKTTIPLYLMGFLY